MITLGYCIDGSLCKTRSCLPSAKGRLSAPSFCATFRRTLFRDEALLTRSSRSIVPVERPPDDALVEGGVRAVICVSPVSATCYTSAQIVFPAGLRIGGSESAEVAILSGRRCMITVSQRTLANVLFATSRRSGKQHDRKQASGCCLRAFFKMAPETLRPVAG